MNAQPLTRLIADATHCMFTLLHCSFFLSLSIYLSCTQEYVLFLTIVILVTPGNQMTKAKGPIMNRADSLVKKLLKYDAYPILTIPLSLSLSLSLSLLYRVLSYRCDSPLLSICIIAHNYTFAYSFCSETIRLSSIHRCIVMMDGTVAFESPETFDHL